MHQNLNLAFYPSYYWDLLGVSMACYSASTDVSACIVSAILASDNLPTSMSDIIHTLTVVSLSSRLAACPDDSVSGLIRLKPFQPSRASLTVLPYTSTPAR